MIRTLSITAALALFVRSAFAGIVVTGGGLTLEEEGGTFAINNLAASGTAFAKDLLEGYPSHTIPHLNDATYGNINSWIAGSANSFAGINLGATLVAVNRIAFGRDNLGVQTGDRVIDTYTLQYTTVANPDPSTQDDSWTTIETPINSSSILTLNAATGLFSGSSSLPGTPARKAHFNGQIVRIIGSPTTTTRSYGYFLLPQPTAPPAQQSGGVILSSP